MKGRTQIKTGRLIKNLLLTEGVQARQNLGVVIMVQTDAADEELLVNLPHHRAGAAGLTLGHNDRHSHQALGPLNLHTRGETNGRKVMKALRKHSNRVRRAYSLVQRKA